jgi:F0F1-type ATP synthase membrane subunit b/b'
MLNQPPGQDPEDDDDSQQVDPPVDPVVEEPPKPVLGPDGKPLDVARAAKLLEDVREDKAKLQKQVQELSQKVKGFEDQNRSTEEKLTQERDELKSQVATLTKELSDLRLTQAVSNVARSLRFRDPDDAFRYLDQDDLKFDDQGHPTNVDALLKEVVEKKKYLVGEPEEDPDQNQSRQTRPARLPISPPIQGNRNPAAPSSADSLRGQYGGVL